MTETKPADSGAEEAAATVLRGRDVQDIMELKRQGLSIRAISRLTGYCRRTIRKYLGDPEGRPVYGPRPPQAGKLEQFKAYLEERTGVGVWNGRVLLRELRQQGYDGSYTLLTDWLRPRRQSAETIAVRRFETPPGKQAQVDWGHLGTIEVDGITRKLWGFAFTLGYSRMMFARGGSGSEARDVAADARASVPPAWRRAGRDPL